MDNNQNKQKQTQNNKPRKSPNKKGSSTFSFILPYLIILGIILLLVTTLSPRKGAKSLDFGGDIVTFEETMNNVEDKNLGKVVIEEREKIITVTGQYKGFDPYVKI